MLKSDFKNITASTPLIMIDSSDREMTEEEKAYKIRSINLQWKDFRNRPWSRKTKWSLDRINELLSDELVRLNIY